MSKCLLIYAHDFQINLKKSFKAHDVHMLDINAAVMNNATHKNYRLMSELVKCLFEGYEKLTLVTHFSPENGHQNLIGERSLAFILKTNDIKDTYELHDFHAAVMAHLASHRLLAESQVFLSKELVSSQLSKAANNIKALDSLMNDYAALISKSKSVFDRYREDIVLRFGVKP